MSNCLKWERYLATEKTSPPTPENNFAEESCPAVEGEVARKSYHSFPVGRHQMLPVALAEHPVGPLEGVIVLAHRQEPGNGREEGGGKGAAKGKAHQLGEGGNITNLWSLLE